MTDVAPSFVTPQVEAYQFGNPVSEASAAAIAAVASAFLGVMLPVGSIIASMLYDNGDGTHPVNFQGQLAAWGATTPTWVLADGRSVVGSAFQTLTGLTNVPDLRGIMLRGLNYGGSAAGVRNDGNQNPDDPSGTFTPGQYTADRVGPHQHTAGPGYNINGVSTAGNGSSTYFNAFARTNASALGSSANPYATDIGFPNGSPGSWLYETAPKNVSINWFIRIN